MLHPVSTIRLSGTAASGLALGNDRLWVTRRGESIHAARSWPSIATNGQIVSTTPVTLAPNVQLGLVADEWAVWLSSDTTPPLKVDPRTGAVIAAIELGGGIPMTIAHGLVWGAGPHHVWAVDPLTDEWRVSIALEDTIEVFGLAVTDNAIWAAVRRPGYIGRVLRLDLATGELTGEAEVALPARVLPANGDVFVIDWETNSLLRFRP